MAHGEQQDRFAYHLGCLIASALEASGVELAGESGGQRMKSYQAAADYLDIGQTKLRELVAEGTLPQPIEIGGRPKFDRRELDKYIDRQRRAQRKR